MAIEDILQVKDTVRGNPMGDSQAVNQMEFLRFQEQMGLGQGEVVGKLIQMFMKAPSEFTAKFGVESADAIRELMEMTTQKKLEGQGKVFAPDSAEIIGQNIGYRPDQSAIGTLQTDQADESEEMMKFLQNQLDTGQVREEKDTGQVWREEQEKKEKNFLVDIMKDIIQGGMDTGSGIINAIMDEAKQLYREHTEKSPNYDPEFYEKEQLNETTEDYYPPGP